MFYFPVPHPNCIIFEMSSSWHAEPLSERLKIIKWNYYIFTYLSYDDLICSVQYKIYLAFQKVAPIFHRLIFCIGMSLIIHIPVFYFHEISVSIEDVNHILCYIVL